MSVNFIIQPYHSSTPPNFFHNIGLTDPFSLNYRVSKAALDNFLFDVPNNSYTVFVSQVVLDTLKGERPAMTNEEWITLKFLATVLGRQTLVTRANSEINTLEFEVADLEHPPTLPLTTNQWKLKLEPTWNSSEINILNFIAQYKESITHIDLSQINNEDQNTFLIAIIRYCKNIEQLKLYGKHLKINSFRNLNSLTKLTHLEISSCPVTPDFTGMSQLTTLKFSPPLRHEASLDLTPLPNLENLTLKGKIRTDITHLKKLTSLEIRCYEGNRLADLTIFPGLTTLDISLFDHPLPHLNASTMESLTLSSDKITDINFLADFVNLKTLRIEFCHRLEDVSVISRLTNLTSLSFSYCNDLDEIPDLNRHEKLELLEIEALGNLNKLPEVTRSTKVKTSNMQLSETLGSYWSPLDTNEYKIIDDPNCRTVELTTVTPYKLMHLENLPNLTSFYCYFSINVKNVYFKKLGRCESLDFSEIKETKELSIIDSPAIKTIALNAKSIIHLQLVDLPQLEELTIKEFPLLATMQLPPYVERKENDILKFKPVDQNTKNQFLAILSNQILRYKTIKEIEEKRKWKMFHSIMQGEDFLDYIKIIYPNFRTFVSSISPKKAGALPLHARLYFLPRLLPDCVKTTIEAVDPSTLKIWREGNMNFEGADIRISEALCSFKQSYLDKDKEIPPGTMESINKIPGRVFMAFYLDSPSLIEAFIPLMNEYQLAVTIPMMSLEQFEQLLVQQPPKNSKNSVADYLSRATNEQKKVPLKK